MNRQRKVKEVKNYQLPIMNQVDWVFLHPSHFFYVVLCADQYIRIFDNMTMSFVAETSIEGFYIPDKTVVKCCFTDNPNIFILINSQTELRMYQISPGSIQSKKNLHITLPQSKIMMECAIAQPQNLHLEVLVDTGIILYDLQAIQHPQKLIETYADIREGVHIAPYTWILFNQNSFALNIFESGNFSFQESSVKVESYTKQVLLGGSQIFHHSRKKLVMFSQSINCLCLLKYCLKRLEIEIILKIDLIEGQRTNMFNMMSFGVNTSTTHKFENHILVTVLSENIENQPTMLEEGNGQNSKENISIYTVDLQSRTYRLESYERDRRQSHILRELENVVRMWECQTFSNHLLYLRRNKTICSLDMSVFLEGKNIGSEWVNLGYKFEALEQNLQYQELQDQFQIEQQNEGQLKLTNQDLNDWEHSLIPKHLIAKRSEKLDVFEI